MLKQKANKKNKNQQKTLVSIVSIRISIDISIAGIILGMIISIISILLSTRSLQ